MEARKKAAELLVRKTFFLIEVLRKILEYAAIYFTIVCSPKSSCLH